MKLSGTRETFRLIGEMAGASVFDKHGTMVADLAEGVWVFKQVKHRPDAYSPVGYTDSGFLVLQAEDTPIAERMRDSMCVCGGYLARERFIIRDWSSTALHERCIKASVTA